MFDTYMGHEHIEEEMKDAVRDGDSTRARALEMEAEAFEGGEATIDFVPASKAARDQYGVEKCLIIHRLPDNVLNGGPRVGQYTDYLVRQARKEGALIDKENDYCILVQFPDRPQEVFFANGFEGSIRELSRERRDVE